MNVNEYIASGVLEAYVNGLLSDAENKEVDEMANKYPEVRKEIEEIRQAIDIYAEIADGPKPPKLENILATASPHIELADTMPKEENISHIKSFSWQPYLMAAAITLLLLTSLGALYLFSEVQALRTEMASIREENSYIALQYEALRKQPEVIMAHDKIIADPASREISMSGLSDKAGGKVRLYWHEQSHEVYLLIEQLPEPPEGHQYQLWAIIDGVSVDAGIFDHHTNMQKLRRIEGAVSEFAVTLEEKGGKPVPNLGRMYVKGSVSL